MKLLIDADIVLFRSLFATKDQGYYAGLRAIDFTVDRILDRFDFPEFQLALTGSDNFRKKIASSYKANRDPSKRPPYLYEARNYCVKYWGAVVADGMEADDYIGIHHCSDTIACSTDKDFMQLGGKIYNWVKNEIVEVSDPGYYFWCQLLTGDVSDNVKGIKGIGPVKAENLLKDKTNGERKQIVEEMYQKSFGDNWYAEFDTTARLLYILRGYSSSYVDLL